MLPPKVLGEVLLRAMGVWTQSYGLHRAIHGFVDTEGTICPRSCYSAGVFGLGMLEILVIAGLAVLLFPPQELPKLARTVARYYGTIRRVADQFRSALLDDEELRAPFDDVKGAYEKARGDVQKVQQAARRELAKAKLEARIAARRDSVRERQVESSPPIPMPKAATPPSAGSNDSVATGETREASPLRPESEPSSRTDSGPAEEEARAQAPFPAKTPSISSRENQD